MFYDYVTRSGSNIKVGLHAKRPATEPDKYAKHDSRVWIESDDFLTRMAIAFLSNDERQAIADTARRDEEAVANS